MDTRIYGSCRRFNVLMVPWLAHGHISPFLELAKRLTHKNFHIYLCSTPINLTSIRKRIGQNYSHSIQLVELHLPSNLPDLPPHYHTTNGLPLHLMSTLKHAFELSKPAYSTLLKTLKPDLLIYDFNQDPWAPGIASSLNIPSVLFLTGSAVLPSFTYYLRKPDGQHFPFPEIYLRDYEAKRLQEAIDAEVNRTRPDPDDQGKMTMNGSCNLILVKSFQAIEGKYIDFLAQGLGKKVIPVGPLVQDDHDYWREEEQEDEALVVNWLDKKDEASTVFVSFGSEYFLSEEEFEEIAYGLELSKVNFIWVVRFPAEGQKKKKVEEALPDGFLERVKDRGLVVEKWAPQTKILGHSSTGGFVSHCGWSSIMESIKHGVPIIAMPMHLDQPINTRLVTAVGVGMEVVRDESGVKFRREEIADVIRTVVVEKSGEKFREKARELSDILECKGDEEIDNVATELVQLCKTKLQPN